MRNLFDTTSDIAGADIDISRYIREADERNVQVLWRDIPFTGPDKNMPEPEREELCPVSIDELRVFLKNQKNMAWRWDYTEGCWNQPEPLYPGQIVLLSAIIGGYDSKNGFIGKEAKERVHPIELQPMHNNPPEHNDMDQAGKWLSLEDHAKQCEDEMRRLLAVLTGIPEQWHGDLITAAKNHDWGKAHEVFRNALGIAPNPDIIWAKSPVMGRYSRRGFRHELASALALLQTGCTDLAAYLAAAHHGKVRLSIRSLPMEVPPKEGGRFARGIRDGDTLPSIHLNGVDMPEVTLSLALMELGESERGASWLRRMTTLRDRADIGLFRLAFLETLVRATDWHASSGHKGDSNA